MIFKIINSEIPVSVANIVIPKDIFVCLQNLLINGDLLSILYWFSESKLS